MRLALICPDLTGHLNPMTTLGRALERLGHEVTLVGMPGSRAKAESAELGFLSIGDREHESGAFADAASKLGQLRHVAALRSTGHMLRLAAEITLRDAPAALERAGIEGVVADQVAAGPSVAEAMGLPYALVCNALALHQEPGVPPPVLRWTHREGWRARLRNRTGNLLLRAAARPVTRVVNAFRAGHGLPRISLDDLEHAGLVQVAQQPAFFDYPRTGLPDHFHYSGPWHDAERDGGGIPFPWDRLDDRPLVYASLGTLQNRLAPLFERIVEAFAKLTTHVDAQMVLSLGRAGATLDLDPPENVLVVDYAPQLELLRNPRTALVITHAGMNTALEALACGHPMLAIPITNDQPGVAGRLDWLGVAEVLSPGRARVERLRDAMHRLLTEPTRRKEADRYALYLRSGPGVEKPAALIDRALRTGERVVRELEW